MKLFEWLLGSEPEVPEPEIEPEVDPKQRAKDLLVSHLTPLQKEIYLKTGRIPIRGKDKRFYVVGNDEAWWIGVLNKKGRVVENLGAYPHAMYELPIPDKLLAQKLMLETNPKAIWGMACRGGGYSVSPNTAEMQRFINQYRRWWWL